MDRSPTYDTSRKADDGDGDTEIVGFTKSYYTRQEFQLVDGSSGQNKQTLMDKTKQKINTLALTFIAVTLVDKLSQGVIYICGTSKQADLFVRSDPS